MVLGAAAVVGTGDADGTAVSVGVGVAAGWPHAISSMVSMKRGARRVIIRDLSI